jgi:hypothetical protein
MAKKNPKKPKPPPDPTWRKPTSPGKRKEPWINVIVRATTYAMIRELADHHDISCGEVVRITVEHEFQKTLWRIQQDELRAKRGEEKSADKA